MDNITAACSKCKVKDKICENEGGHGPEFCPTINKKGVIRAAMKEYAKEASILTGILEAHDFKVVSTACATGGIPKESIYCWSKTKTRNLTRSDLWAYSSFICKIF